MIQIDENNLTKVSFVSYLILVVFLTVFLGCIFLVDRYHQLETGIQELEKNFIAQKKEQMKDAVLSRIYAMKTRQLLMEEPMSLDQLKASIARVLNKKGVS